MIIVVHFGKKELTDNGYADSGYSRVPQSHVHENKVEVQC